MAYYITPHGFGHAVRSLELIRRLLEKDRELEVILVSDIPEFLIEQCVGRPIAYRRRRLDVGLVQKDSIRFDLDSTLEALLALQEKEKHIVDSEKKFFRDESIRLVVSDIAFLPFRAAADYGIPGIGVSNFTWDWIYRTYSHLNPAWEDLVGWIKGCYSQCRLFLQLPMHGDCSTCPNVQDVPLVCRKPERDVQEVRKILGCDPGRQNILISFSDLRLDDEALKRIEEIENCVFFYKRPLEFRLRNGRCLDNFDLGYAEIVAAMDAVITKPGYGIVADCLATGTAMIYTDRGRFPEYEILVQAIEENLAFAYLPSADLYRGDWETAITAINGQHRSKPHVRDDGASVCAEIILRELEQAIHCEEKQRLWHHPRRG